MSTELDILNDPPYEQHPVQPPSELIIGTVVYAIISQYDRAATAAVVLRDRGERVDVCPTIPGRRFCHDVSRMVVRRKDEMYPEQIRARTQWKKSVRDSDYVCGNCGFASRTHPRDIPFTACPNDECRSKWEMIRIPRVIHAP